MLRLLREYESRNILHAEADRSWPIVWDRAKGASVWDLEGRRYLDLTAAFGVAAAGHGNPALVLAGQRQMGRLLHAMGDVHPHALKAQLARQLSRLTFERWTRSAGARPPLSGKTIFGNSGFEAVEAALKSAMLATGKPGVIAFTGGYHGLGYGALTATHRDFFRLPFASQLGGFVCFAEFPWNLAYPGQAGAGSLKNTERELRTLFRKHRIGAILVEPVQGRAGIRIPPPDFLPLLRRLCDQHRGLLIADEIFTGMGRTGRWFACEHSRTIPDLICLGKALTGGFPLSACVGRADLMDAAWPESKGEALHTSTFLGHPVGCAMALAQLAEIDRLALVRRADQLGRWFLEILARLAPPAPLHMSARGIGLMLGLELWQSDGRPATAEAWRAVKAMLKAGYILLPEGEHGNILSFTPPLVISKPQLKRAGKALERFWAGQ